MRGRRLDPEMRRKYLIFMVIAYLTLVPIGLQLYFDDEGEHAAAVVAGLVALACIAACFGYAKKSGLVQLLRRRR